MVFFDKKAFMFNFYLHIHILMFWDTYVFLLKILERFKEGHTSIFGHFIPNFGRFTHFVVRFIKYLFVTLCSKFKGTFRFSSSIRRMKESKHFLKTWGVISCTAFTLNHLLWWLTTEGGVTPLALYDWSDLVFDFLYCAFYVLVSLSVSNLIRRLFIKKHYSFTQFFFHSGALLVSNVLIAIAFESVMTWIFPISDEIFWNSLFVFTTIATLLTIIYLCLYYSSIIIKQSKRNAEMQKELLKLQLDPHFVFNSLSTLTELITEDTQLAEDFTLKFSAIYRYIVNMLNKETVTIAEEIRFICDYCQLLEIRHSQHFHFQIDDSLTQNHRLILPMSIQILVENAIKHNSHSRRNPLPISIYEEGDYVVVRNKRIPLTGKSPTTNKVGLKNLRERYELLGLQPIVNDNEEEFEVRVPIILKTRKK